MIDRPVLHIVRRFGQVGGMEKYVWELVHTLESLGLKIEIVCEEVCSSHSPNITVHQIPSGVKRPRWRAMASFRERTSAYIRTNQLHKKCIIHSHERSLDHHVTTFHGPPMDSKPILWGIPILNRRINAWRAMERIELTSPNVHCVLPVSRLIEQQLNRLHPGLSSAKHIFIAYPGIHPPDKTYRQSSDREQAAKRFIFIGKEWRRKGLLQAVEIVDHFSRKVDCRLDIYGPDETDLPKGIINHRRINTMGWVDQIPWGKYDALIHPAKIEPFGMIIPEARSFGVPVLCSTLVGSAELGFHGLRCLDISQSIQQWADGLTLVCNDKRAAEPEIKWTYQNLAMLHVNDIYPYILSQLKITN